MIVTLIPEPPWGMNQGLLIAFVSALASVIVVLIANRGKLKSSSTETATQFSGQLFTQLTSLTEEAKSTREELDVCRKQILKLTEDNYIANRAKDEAAEEIVTLKERCQKLEEHITLLKSDNEQLNRLISQITHNNWTGPAKP